MSAGKMMTVQQFCLTAAFATQGLKTYKDQAAWNEANSEYVREDGLVTKPRLISPGAFAWFDGEDAAKITAWNHVRLTIAGLRVATNELTGQEFLVLQDLPNARGFALTACLPATEELKSSLEPGMIIEGSALLMGHNATIPAEAAKAAEANSADGAGDEAGGTDGASGTGSESSAGRANEEN